MPEKLKPEKQTSGNIPYDIPLAKDCYAIKLDLLTNATEVDDAIRFVTANTNDKKAVIRATSGIEVESNQRNIIKDDVHEQRRPADNHVSMSTSNQVF